MISYSQRVNDHSADIHTIQHYINSPNTTGTFIELGAFDGFHYSNTKLLEDNLKFSGILIEPSPISFKKLVINRPNCKNYNCAISQKQGTIEFMGDNRAVGGINLTEEWTTAWNINRNNNVKVKTARLSDIIKESGLKYIDFFSLDVEGSELDVLKTIDWSIPIYIIVMEVASVTANVDGEKNVEECRKILRAQGFTSDEKRYGLDEWWINENYFRKDLLFKPLKNDPMTQSPQTNSRD